MRHAAGSGVPARAHPLPQRGRDREGQLLARANHPRGHGGPHQHADAGPPGHDALGRGSVGGVLRGYAETTRGPSRSQSEAPPEAAAIRESVLDEDFRRTTWTGFRALTNERRTGNTD